MNRLCSSSMAIVTRNRLPRLAEFDPAARRQEAGRPRSLASTTSCLRLLHGSSPRRAGRGTHSTRRPTAPSVASYREGALRRRALASSTSDGKFVAGLRMGLCKGSGDEADDLASPAAVAQKKVRGGHHRCRQWRRDAAKLHSDRDGDPPAGARGEDGRSGPAKVLRTYGVDPTRCRIHRAARRTLRLSIPRRAGVGPKKRRSLPPAATAPSKPRSEGKFRRQAEAVRITARSPNGATAPPSLPTRPESEWRRRGGLAREWELKPPGRSPHELQSHSRERLVQARQGRPRLVSGLIPSRG